MIRSATAFLPDSMMTFMNLDRSTEPNLGSGRMSRLGTSRRRGISLFLLLQLAPASRTPGQPLDRPLTRRPEGRHKTGTRHGAGPGQSDDGLEAVFPVCVASAERYAFFGRLAPYLERDCLRSLT